MDLENLAKSVLIGSVFLAVAAIPAVLPKAKENVSDPFICKNYSSSWQGSSILTNDFRAYHSLSYDLSKKGQTTLKWKASFKADESTVGDEIRTYIDLNGDGILDILKSSRRMEGYHSIPNEPRAQWVENWLGATWEKKEIKPDMQEEFVKGMSEIRYSAARSHSLE